MVASLIILHLTEIGKAQCKEKQWGGIIKGIGKAVCILSCLFL